MTTPENPPPDQERVEALIQAAMELNQNVAAMANESGSQFVSLARTARHNRILIIATIGSLFLDLAITVVLALVGMTAVNNSERINDFAQAQAEQATEQRKRALCPLYGIFLDSKSEQGRKAAPDPAKYDHAFEVIEDGYRVLGCDKFLQESGRDKW